ncbi:hypothetical protein GC163_20365 [bacterium]|nr:hypothetical protein [bacterium]
MNTTINAVEPQNPVPLGLASNRTQIPSAVYCSVEEFVQEGLPGLLGTRCLIVQLNVSDSSSRHPIEQLALLLTESHVTATSSPENLGQERASSLEDRVSVLKVEETLRTVAQRFMEQYSGEEVLTILDGLSRREWEVLLGLLDGQNCKQIASDLEIGFATVAKHRSHLLQKLHVKTLAELTTLLWSTVLLASQRSSVAGHKISGISSEPGYQP